MTDLEQEHDDMVRALGAAQVAVDGFTEVPSATSAAGARTAIGGLVQVLTSHLAHEERDLNPFSDAHQSTRPVKAAAAAARKQHTEGSGHFFACLADDCNEENARALRHEVPAPVLFVLTKLGAPKYQRAIASAWVDPRAAAAAPAR